jgi:hypothetical protein
LVNKGANPSLLVDIVNWQRGVFKNNRKVYPFLYDEKENWLRIELFRDTIFVVN